MELLQTVSACFNKLFEHVLTCLKMLACKEVTVGFHMFETVYNRSLDVRSLEKSIHLIRSHSVPIPPNPNS